MRLVRVEVAMLIGSIGHRGEGTEDARVEARSVGFPFAHSRCILEAGGKTRSCLQSWW